MQHLANHVDHRIVYRIIERQGRVTIYNRDDQGTISPILAKMLSFGLLERSGERARLTVEGFRIFYTLGYALRFSNTYSIWTGWEQYLSEIHALNPYTPVSTRSSLLVPVQEWCLDNNVAIQTGEAIFDPKNNNWAVAVEEKNRIKFMLAWT